VLEVNAGAWEEGREEGPAPQEVPAGGSAGDRIQGLGMRMKRVRMTGGIH
jgi:hypothetical protein